MFFPVVMPGKILLLIEEGGDSLPFLENVVGHLSMKTPSVNNISKCRNSNEG